MADWRRWTRKGSGVSDNDFLMTASKGKSVTQFHTGETSRGPLNVISPTLSVQTARECRPCSDLYMPYSNAFPTTLPLNNNSLNNFCW